MSGLRLIGLLTILVLVGLVPAAELASASTQTFRNPTPITTQPPGGDTGPGAPYPASIVVSGMPAAITDVTVTLHGVTHSRPKDVDIVLVSPSGVTVKVIGEACGTAAITDFTWVFDQDAPSTMPEDGPCGESIYKPTSRDVGNAPSPAPSGPYGASFDAFNGGPANGTWSLYAYDLVPGKFGGILRGWSLTVTTASPDTVIPATGTSGPAAPYPAVRTLSGYTDVITDVIVSVEGVTHQRPDDLDLLLVGPQGEKVVLMSDACGTREAAGRNWLWDDEAPAPMTIGDDFSTCGQRRHRPTDAEPGDSWPAPAPSGPYTTTLSVFDATDPNGDWRLFVNDDASNNVGFIAFRFKLSIATRSRTPVAFTESAVEVPEGATRTLTLKRSAPTSLGVGSVTVTSAPASARSGIDFTPVSTVVRFGPGETEKTVRIRALTDADREPAEAFAVTIGSPTGDAATGTPSSVSVTIPANDPGPPRPGPPPPPGSGEDRTAPRLAALSLTQPRFRAGGRARGVPRGTRIRFILSEAATVDVAVQRAVTGRRVNGRCRDTGPSKRRATRCTLWRRVGSFRIVGHLGANAKPFSGKLGRRTLRPGGYRLGLVATDAARNRSHEKLIWFTVLR